MGLSLSTLEAVLVACERLVWALNLVVTRILIARRGWEGRRVAAVLREIAQDPELRQVVKGESADRVLDAVERYGEDVSLLVERGGLLHRDAIRTLYEAKIALEAERRRMRELEERARE